VSKKSRQRGKSNQRAFLKLVKEVDETVKNIGIAGQEDLYGDYVVLECKERETLPKWLFHAFQQLREHEHSEKIHVVQLHLLRSRHLNDLIIMTAKTFLRLLRSFIEIKKRGGNGESNSTCSS